MGHPLTSWKEIAAHLGKGVRTVQRWERELQLPVRRPNQSDKHVVVAFPEELDEWLRTRLSVREQPHPHLADGDSVTVVAERTRLLRTNAEQHIARLSALLGELKEGLSAQRGLKRKLAQQRQAQQSKMSP